MAIREMRKDECLQLLATAKLARLACAHDNQPYVVPVYIACQESAEGEPGLPCLYGFTTAGQKVEWMRANPRVCVEADEVEAADRWRSVIVIGRYEELPEIPDSDDLRLRTQERPQRAAEAALSHEWAEDERMQAYRLLQAKIGWWQPGYAAWEARPRPDPKESYSPIYYKIRIEQITGHEATKEALPSLMPRQSCSSDDGVGCVAR